jgi:hypothetical protein
MVFAHRGLQLEVGANRLWCDWVVLPYVLEELVVGASTSGSHRSYFSFMGQTQLLATVEYVSFLI